MTEELEGQNIEVKEGLVQPIVDGEGKEAVRDYLLPKDDDDIEANLLPAKPA